MAVCRLLYRSLSFTSAETSRNCLTLVPRHSVAGCRDLAQPRTFQYSSFTSNKSEHTSHVWLLRYSHDNGYLSWSRNAVICAGVGATAHLTGACSTTFCSYFETGFMDLGVVFMTVGSLHHIASSVYLRDELGISWPGLGWILLYTSAIWLFYVNLVPSQLKKAITI